MILCSNMYTCVIFHVLFCYIGAVIKAQPTFLAKKKNGRERHLGLHTSLLAILLIKLQMYTGSNDSFDSFGMYNVWIVQ